MKTKVSISITITICAIFLTILYIVYAAIPLSKEYHFNPEWQIDLSNPVIKEDKSSRVIPFCLGQNLGYFTEEGDITFFKSFPNKAEISDYCFTIYNTEASNIPFYNPQGQETGIINGSGFPFINDDRIYLLLPGGTSYSLQNENGNTKWTCENVIPLTALSSNKYFTISGYANGVIKVISNATGDTITTFTPGGSDFSVIYGANISPDGKYIATISGQNPQRFLITQREQNQTKVVFHKDLQFQLNRRTILYFSQDGNSILYNCKEGLGIYDLVQNKEFCFKLNEKIIQIQETENLYFILSKTDDNFTVSIIEKTNSKVGSFIFKANNAFIKTNGENLYVGKDELISKISVTKD